MICTGIVYDVVNRALSVPSVTTDNVYRDAEYESWRDAKYGLTVILGVPSNCIATRLRESSWYSA